MCSCECGLRVFFEWKKRKEERHQWATPTPGRARKIRTEHRVSRAGLGLISERACHNRPDFQLMRGNSYCNGAESFDRPVARLLHELLG
jgi:hypothetical protein